MAKRSVPTIANAAWNSVGTARNTRLCQPAFAGKVRRRAGAGTSGECLEGGRRFNALLTAIGAVRSSPEPTGPANVRFAYRAHRLHSAERDLPCFRRSRAASTEIFVKLNVDVL